MKNPYLDTKNSYLYEGMPTIDENLPLAGAILSSLAGFRVTDCVGDPKQKEYLFLLSEHTVYQNITEKEGEKVLTGKLPIKSHTFCCFIKDESKFIKHKEGVGYEATIGFSSPIMQIIPFRYNVLKQLTDDELTSIMKDLD